MRTDESGMGWEPKFHHKSTPKIYMTAILSDIDIHDLFDKEPKNGETVFKKEGFCFEWYSHVIECEEVSYSVRTITGKIKEMHEDDYSISAFYPIWNVEDVFSKNDTLVQMKGNNCLIASLNPINLNDYFE